MSDDGIQQVSAGFFKSLFGQAGEFINNLRRKRRLKAMLTDPRFTFRSMKQLSDGIHCDEDTTAKLLLAIDARKSEVSDEWTLK